ncbi:MAG: cellulose synthase catalytic subunit, partial [Cyanobacteria bacterium J06631_6]
MQTIKPVSGSRRERYDAPRVRRRLPVQTPTLLILSMLGFVSAIAISWSLGNSQVTALFIQLHLIQSNPPQWLMPPQLDSNYYLLLPTLVLFIAAQVIMKLSPQPQIWSQRLVGTIFLALFIRYFLWRSLTTLNFSNPADGVFSVSLFAMELLAMIGSAFQMLLLFTAKNRDRQAEKCSIAVRERRFNPT